MKNNTLICLMRTVFYKSGFVPLLGLSVRQTPEKVHITEGVNVSINCYIEADSRSERIFVLWLKNNLVVTSENFDTSKHRLCRVNATLHLPSIHPNHSGIYYCKVLIDIPRLETAYGEGTHVYIGEIFI